MMSILSTKVARNESLLKALQKTRGLTSLVLSMVCLNDMKYERPFRLPKALDVDLRVDILEYCECRIPLDEFINWLNLVEWVFDYKEVLDERRVKIVALKLKKFASAWWE